MCVSLLWRFLFQFCPAAYKLSNRTAILVNQEECNNGIYTLGKGHQAAEQDNGASQEVDFKKGTKMEGDTRAYGKDQGTEGLK